MTIGNLYSMIYPEMVEERPELFQDEPSRTRTKVTGTLLLRDQGDREEVSDDRRLVLVIGLLAVPKDEGFGDDPYGLLHETVGVMNDEGNALLLKLRPGKEPPKDINIRGAGVAGLLRSVMWRV